MQIRPIPSEPANPRILSRHAPVTRTKASAIYFLTLCLSVTILCGLAAAQTGGTYQVTNIVSDGSVPATTTDANFINPWGIADGPAFWIDAEGTGFNYVVQATGTIPFKVSIPAASGLSTSTGTPAGAAYTGSATGFVLPNGTKATFLFASLDGVITGWNNKLGTTGSVAQVAVNNSAAKATYTGMALVTNANGTYILVTDFGTNAAVGVYDSTFKPAKLAGSFTDPNLPANYAPFAVHVLGTQVFVTFALRTAPPSPGNGLVDVFDTSGNFVARAITGGNLDSPWGVAIAPTAFGIYGGDLLVGNFGDGIINVYDPKTYSYLGQLADGTGKTLKYLNLWELIFGNAPTTAGTLNTLYFTAGLGNEAHGLLGAIANNATATGTPTFGLSASGSFFFNAAGSSTQAIISVAPTNNFSGTVTLACSGLPIASTCSFSPAQVTATASAPATSTITIQTTKDTALLQPRTLRGMYTAGIAAAFLLPFGSIFAFTRRRSSKKASNLRFLALLGVLFVSLGLAAGCSGARTPPAPTPFTPDGTSQITITATSGAITQSTVIAVDVQ